MIKSINIQNNVCFLLPAWSAYLEMNHSEKNLQGSARLEHLSVVWPTVNIVYFLSLLFTMLTATEWGDEENLYYFI